MLLWRTVPDYIVACDAMVTTGVMLRQLCPILSFTNYVGLLVPLTSLGIQSPGQKLLVPGRLDDQQTCRITECDDAMNLLGEDTI